MLFGVYSDGYDSCTTKVKPAVHVAHFKTLMNAWLTACRMRSYAPSVSGARARSCLVCRGATDCIEHLPHCTVVRDFFARHGSSCNELLSFFGLDQNSFPHGFILKAKLISALFVVHSSLHFSRGSAHHFDLPQLMAAVASFVLGRKWVVHAS